MGYIETIRGKNGGIRLARAPENINLGILIKQIEPDFALVECFAATVPKTDATTQQGLPITLIDETADETANKASSVTKQGCAISPVCRLKGVFFEALTAFVSVLEGYTLSLIHI